MASPKRDSKIIAWIYTTGIMTAKDFCDTVRYRKEKSGFEKRIWERKKMFTVIRKSYFYLENQEDESLTRNERDFDLIYSDKIRFVRKTAIKDVGLSC